MGNIFRLDSPLMKLLTLITNLLCLNVIWLISCIPIVTAGAATTAMYYVVFQYINKKDDAVLKPFFHSFKENFRLVTPVWIMNLLIHGVFVAEFFYISRGAENWLKIAVVVLLFIYVGASSYLYPLFARFQTTAGNAIRNSFALSVRHFPSTFCMVLLNLMPVVLILLAPDSFFDLSMVWLLGGFSLIAYINGWILKVVFKKYEPEETEEQDG